MDKQLFVYMAIAVSVVIPVTWYIIQQIDKKDKARNNVGAIIAIKNSKKTNMFVRLYDIFINIPFSHGYIERIRRRYELLYPGEAKEITKRTMQAVILSWLCCIVSLIIVLRSKLNFNNTSVSIILIYAVNAEIIGFMLIRMEIKLMEEIAIFIANVRHNYHINRIVDDAILLSMDGMSYEMKVHIQKLYEITTSNRLKEDVANYNATISNKYLRMFLSLCAGVIEYSDKRVNGQMLFISNLENLKKEIDIEVLRLKNIRFKFSGVSLITIGVIVPIDAIKSYGVSMMTELESFYNGTAGIIYVTITLIITLIIYILNNRLKGINQTPVRNYKYLRKLEKIRFIKMILDNYMEKHYGKMLKIEEELKKLGETISSRLFLLKRIIYGVSALIAVTGFVFYIHASNRANLTGIVTNAASITAATYMNTDTSIVKETIINFVSTHKDTKNITVEQMSQSIRDSGAFHNEKIISAVAEETVKRIYSYQNEYFKWYELIVCLIAAALAYYMPNWMLWYRKKVLLMNMEDEVTQFNSIIFMMMYNDHITVKDLLEELELFAVVFKKTIQECINEYNSGETEALARMKEKETFRLFRQLVDNLIRCDAMSIDKAFDHISADRQNYHDRRKQENEQSVQKRINIAQPLSFVPTFLVMIYLTGPMILASLRELANFKEMMTNI